MKRAIVFSLLAISMIAANAVSASAQVDGNPFSIDGVVTDTENSGQSTGYTIPPCDAPAVGGGATGNSPQACKQNDPNGNTQEIGPLNSNTTKIGVIHNAHIKTSGKVGPTNCTPAAPCYISMMNTTNPNAQVDLNASWIQSKVATVNGTPHVFLYFAWRRDSNSGSGFISLEIQKALAGGVRDNCNYDSATFNPDNCNPWAGRQGGDVLFLWDQSGSSTSIIAAGISGPAVPANQLGLFPSALNLPDCSHSGDCAELTAANVAQAEFGTDCGDGFEAGMCGEMVVDLTALGVFSANPTHCESIANIIPGTVTGNSNTADYKDVVLAPFPSISNCGTLKVTKKTVLPNGNILTTVSGTFGYIADKTGNVRFAEDAANHPEDGAAPQANLDKSSGLTNCTSAPASVTESTPCGPVVTHTDLIAGSDWTLAEKAVSTPWVKLTIVCQTGSDTAVDVTAAGTTFELKPNTTTFCVITNQLVLGDPTGASRQYVTIADQIKIVQLTAGGASKAAPALARNIVRVFLYSAGCGDTGTLAQVGPNNQGYYDFTLDGASAEVAGKQDLYMNGNSAAFLSKVITAEGTSAYRWAFRWDGDTFNNGLTTAQTCSSPNESVSVTISAPQATIP